MLEVVWTLWVSIMLVDMVIIVTNCIDEKREITSLIFRGFPQKNFPPSIQLSVTKVLPFFLFTVLEHF